MKLSRVAVSDFRKLSRVTIEGLAAGLNVIVGDNEAGKSTLLAAMRAALFERHRVSGQVVEDMLPYGRQVQPTAEIDFKMGGASYRLLKSFGQRPEALLVGPGGQQWQGDAADEELARILGFTRPGRGESKPDQHHGVFGMMWVSQGTSHHGPAVGAAREQVAGALEREVGEVAGGEHGRLQLQLAQNRLEQFWDKLRRPRGDYKKAAEQLAELRVRRESLEERLKTLEAEIDRLGEVRLRLGAYSSDGTLEQARQAAAEAEQAVVALEGLQQRVASARDVVKLAELGHANAVRNRATRQDLLEAVRKAAVSLDTDRSAAETARVLLERLETHAGTAREAAATATGAEQDASQALQQVEAAAASQRLREMVSAGRQQLGTAEDLERKRLAALAVVSANAIDAAAIVRLEAMSAALRDAKSRLEAASVRLQLRPNFGGAAEADGAIVQQDELVIARDTTVHLFGYGEIHVRPGGGVAELEQAVRSAERKLADALAALSHPDVDSAKAAWEVRKVAQQELPFLDQSLAGLAPAGLDRLRQDVEARAAEWDRAAGTDIGISPEQVEAAKREWQASVERSHEARRQSEAASGEAYEARSALAVAAERESASQRADQQARDALTAARLAAADAELDELEQAAVLALDDARVAHNAAIVRLKQAEPELAILRRDSAREALSSIETKVEELKQTRIQLEASLQTQGREGLGEQLADLDGQIALMDQQLQRQHVEARAAELLLDTLVQAQRETKERWLRPIHDRAIPYLNLLHAGSELELDNDTLGLRAVRRNDLVEPFDGLSMGAREQIAVITRVALADILSDAGHASCLVLDDPLVNADQRRLERMHRVLHRAAERHQILILTCRERDFLGLGAHIVRL